MYTNELATEAEKRTSNSESWEGTLVLVAYYMLLQAATGSKLQELLYMAAWSTGRKDAQWSVDKCAKLRLPRWMRNERDYLNRVELPVTDGFREILRYDRWCGGFAEGPEHEEDTDCRDRDTCLNGAWVVAFSTSAVPRWEYQYGSPFLEMTAEIKEGDDKWADLARNVLLHPKSTIHKTARKKLNALFQWEELTGVVEREA